jgi:TPP-dependent trihydroxycyclohexane-1,2-dione (THcHDO) dehydratase
MGFGNFLQIAAIVAAPFTGGASLAIAAGVFAAGSVISTEEANKTARKVKKTNNAIAEQNRVREEARLVRETRRKRASSIARGAGAGTLAASTTTALTPILNTQFGTESTFLNERTGLTIQQNNLEYKGQIAQNYNNLASSLASAPGTVKSIRGVTNPDGKNWTL